MKIICIGRNYAAHAKELGNEVPSEPVIFLKPDTALLKDNKPFYLPDWSDDIHYEAEIVLKIGRNGKYIDEKFAHKYISEFTLGIDFTARDLQSKLKTKGLPWELSKGFDNSAVIGEFRPFSEKMNEENINFRLHKNETIVQQGNTKNLIFSFSAIIAFASRYFSLKMGDLIFTGTPEGVGPIQQGDLLQGYVDEKEVFYCNIR